MSAFNNCTNLITVSVDAQNGSYESLDGVLFNKAQTTLLQFPGGKGGHYEIPNSVTNVGPSAFNGCAEVTSITIPSSVSTISPGAFSACRRLTSVDLSENLTSIGEGAFYDCASLTNFVIPAVVTNIGGYALFGCVRLMAITVDEQNALYSSVGGLLLNKGGDTLIQCPGGKVGVVIPPTVTRIAERAFAMCTNLTFASIPSGVSDLGSGAFSFCYSLRGVTIPTSLSYIADSAFAECFSLTNVQIHGGITNIGERAFATCTSLMAINVDAPNGFYRSLDGLLYDKDLTRLITCPGGKSGNVTIPDGVSMIWFRAFSDCVDLTSIRLPASITNIRSSAFSLCDNLSGVYFKGDAPEVESSIFYVTYTPTVYHLPGTTGWRPLLGGRPTALWQPQIETTDNDFGVRTHQFGFNISWVSGMTVAVDASTNLANPVWTGLETNILTADSYYFSDLGWTNHPARFYRVRWP